MRSKMFAVLAVVALTGSLMAITAGPASAYSGVTLEVTKEVVAGPAVDATFTVHYSCTDVNGDVDETGSKDLNWRETGNGWKLSPSTATFDVSFGGQIKSDVTCVITETAVAGAVTTVTCDNADTGATCGAGGTVVISSADKGGSPTVSFTMVNDFTPVPTPAPTPTPATPASAVTATPRFTG